MSNKRMARNSQNSLASKMLTRASIVLHHRYFSVPTVGYAILKQALYEKYDLPQISYKVAFINRTLLEGKDIIEQIIRSSRAPCY